MFRAPSRASLFDGRRYFISPSFFFYSFSFGPRIIVYRELFSTRRLFSRRGARHVPFSLFLLFLRPGEEPKSRVTVVRHRHPGRRSRRYKLPRDMSLPFAFSRPFFFLFFCTISNFFYRFPLSIVPSHSHLFLRNYLSLSLNSFYPLYQQNANT